MSCQELKLVCTAGTLHISKFAGQITITPVVGKIGDTVSLTRDQADLLRLFLQEYLR